MFAVHLRHRTILKEAILDSQVLHVLLHVRAFGCFQQHGMLAKACVVQQQPKALQADVTFADVFVAIHPAAQVAL